MTCLILKWFMHPGGNRYLRDWGEGRECVGLMSKKKNTEKGPPKLLRSTNLVYLVTKLWHPLIIFMLK